MTKKEFSLSLKSMASNLNALIMDAGVHTNTPLYANLRAVGLLLDCARLCVSDFDNYECDE